jgi:hypothetical protein
MTGGRLCRRRKSTTDENQVLFNGWDHSTIYYDQKNTYQVGEAGVQEILKEANVAFPYECESILNQEST